MGKFDPGAFFKRNGSMTTMIILVVLVGLGEKMAERFLPLYLLAIGGSTWVIGLINSMDNLLSALYSLPGGYLADRIGYKKSLQLFTAVAMFGYLIVILIPAWQAVIVGTVFFISWTSVSLPAIMSLVAKAVPREKRSFGVSLHSFFRRIPMALGPVIGGVLIGAYGRTNGVRAAFAAAFAMGVLALVLVQRCMADDGPAKSDGQAALTGTRHLFSPAMRNLLASDILVRFAEQIPYAFVVRGFKEFGEPTRKALIMDLAPEDAKARAFGAYYLGRLEQSCLPSSGKTCRRRAETPRMPRE